ncbi:hypothetical protein [Nostoc sp. 'Lobaria pulmonaria (5183) cyanobiont']|uniref:hypothetical protein n=1 Tax=Nostoc sp. 'Lobaria pulmonaria (5183) cyanobiont' TaxID=1618022 RepID=UPI00131A245B|nr:hypothetical protein [Nostoc sp. 'Lobaria pulmonaria (5183) cyanobiont']
MRYQHFVWFVGLPCGILLRSSNASCFSQGETLREQVGRAAQRTGSPTYTRVIL